MIKIKILIILCVLLLIGCDMKTKVDLRPSLKDILKIRCYEAKSLALKSIDSTNNMIEREEKMIKEFNYTQDGIDWEKAKKHTITEYNKLCSKYTGKI